MFRIIKLAIYLAVGFGVFTVWQIIENNQETIRSNLQHIGENISNSVDNMAQIGMQQVQDMTDNALQNLNDTTEQYARELME